MYERSYMHRDVVDHVCVTKTEFVITSSVDGYVKFWKKQKRGIEFVKGFRAHLGAILAQAASHDGQMFATASSDKQIKVFDVANFDMFGIISAPCIPSAICWVRDPLDQSTCIAVADSESPVVYVFDPYGSPEPKRVIKGIHRQPVKLMAYNHAYGCMVSIDKGGMVEYWAIEEPHGLPPLVDFELKSQTDLYEFKKSKCAPNSLELSADFEMFVCTSIGDSTIRVFKFSTGRLYRKYDESAAAGNSIQNNCEGGLFKLDDMEFGRRMAVENEVVKSPAGAKMNAVFDASGRFLILTSLLGIKIIKLATNRVVKVLGKPEPHRFISIALFQESPDHPASSIDLAASSNPNAKKGTGDPTLFCTAFKKNRFYMFTREEPDHSAQDNSRD
ncbi:Peptidyl-prolyl cis-trans isomerase cyp15, partial [Dipsacomyces acuminosporus]